MTKGVTQFYTPREMADIMGVDVRTIRKAVAAGEMPAVRFTSGPSSTMRVQQEDFWAWVERKKQEAQGGSSNDH